MFIILIVLLIFILCQTLHISTERGLMIDFSSLSVTLSNRVAWNLTSQYLCLAALTDPELSVCSRGSPEVAWPVARALLKPMSTFAIACGYVAENGLTHIYIYIYIYS